MPVRKPAFSLTSKPLAVPEHPISVFAKAVDSAMRRMEVTGVQPGILEELEAKRRVAERSASPLMERKTTLSPVESALLRAYSANAKLLNRLKGRF
ncbi:MAG: hypothetical protein WC607_01940 [Candidatus Micrarchaeia archaeon]